MKSEELTAIHYQLQMLKDAINKIYPVEGTPLRWKTLASGMATYIDGNVCEMKDKLKIREDIMKADA